MIEPVNHPAEFATVAATVRSAFADPGSHDGDKIDATAMRREVRSWVDVLEVAHNEEIVQLCDTLNLICDTLDGIGYKPWVGNDPLVVAYWAARKEASRLRGISRKGDD